MILVMILSLISLLGGAIEREQFAGQGARDRAPARQALGSSAATIFCAAANDRSSRKREIIDEIGSSTLIWRS